MQRHSRARRVYPYRIRAEGWRDRQPDRAGRAVLQSGGAQLCAAHADAQPRAHCGRNRTVRLCHADRNRGDSRGALKYPEERGGLPGGAALPALILPFGDHDRLRHCLSCGGHRLHGHGALRTDPLGCAYRRRVPLSGARARGERRRRRHHPERRDGRYAGRDSIGKGGRGIRLCHHQRA